MKVPSETVRALIMPEHTAHTNNPGTMELVRISTSYVHTDKMKWSYISRFMLFVACQPVVLHK